MTKSRCLVVIFDAANINPALVMLRSLADNYTKHLDIVCAIPVELHTKWIEDKLQDVLPASTLNPVVVSSRDVDYSIAALVEKAELYPKHISSMALAKCWIPTYCTGYDEAVYVDTDCLFTRDATEFIEFQLNGRALLATQELVIPDTGSYDTASRAYFNNGVFITDLSYWRDNDIEKTLAEWISSNDPGPCIEQTAMNAIFHDTWAAMTSRFNCFVDENPYLLVYKDSVVFHFLGPNKPWIPVEQPKKQLPSSEQFKHNLRNSWLTYYDLVT